MSTMQVILGGEGGMPVFHGQDCVRSVGFDGVGL